MKLDVTDILNGRVSSMDIEINDIVLTDEDRRMIPDNISVKDGGITVVGRITDTGGYMSLSSDVKVTYTTPCDRCLEETEFSVEFPFDRVISASSSPEDRERKISEDDEEWDGVTDDLIYVSDGKLDFTSELAETISLELPFRNLCSEDCKGLCPVCGKKINEEHSGCEIPKEIDPRLAILKKLLANSEDM